MKKFNFKEVKVKDINNQEVPEVPVHQILANELYNGTSSTELLKLAKDINNGTPVDLKDNDINQIRGILNNPYSMLKAFIKVAVLDYIEQIIDENGGTIDGKENMKKLEDIAKPKFKTK